MRVVLDTCVLKLATLPNPINPAALVVKLGLAGCFECWASPPVLEEYAEVLVTEPELLAAIQEHFEVCYPLTRLDIIRHEPDNRFVECALSVGADYLVTVNTKRGHFDRLAYGTTRVATPGAFVNLPRVQAWIASHLD